jgi:hypothetical protein
MYMTPFEKKSSFTFAGFRKHVIPAWGCAVAGIYTF